MATKRTQDEQTPTGQQYAFPEHCLIITAESLEEANETLKNILLSNT